MIEVDLAIFFFIFNSLIFLFFKKISEIINIYDIPDNQRKIHTTKVACIGGLILMANLIFLLLLSYFYNLNYIFGLYFENKLSTFVIFCICLTFFLIVGVYDDTYSINPNIKLILFSLIVFFLVMSDKGLQLNIIRMSFLKNHYDISNISIFFTVFCFLVFINAFNMYDGINLQSSSLSLFIFCYLFFLSNYKDPFSQVLIIFLIFFSILNLKNKLFLGDNGTLVISFLISYAIIKYYNKEIIFYADQVILLLLLPVLDLLRIFFMRLKRGKHPFHPDNIHIHHIILKKYSYKFTISFVFIIYFIPVLCGLIFFKFYFFIIIQILLYFIVLIKFLKISNDK